MLLSLILSPVSFSFFDRGSKGHEVCSVWRLLRVVSSQRARAVDTRKEICYLYPRTDLSGTRTPVQKRRKGQVWLSRRRSAPQGGALALVGTCRTFTRFVSPKAVLCPFLGKRWHEAGVSASKTSNEQAVGDTKRSRLRLSFFLPFLICRQAVGRDV